MRGPRCIACKRIGRRGHFRWRQWVPGYMNGLLVNNRGGFSATVLRYGGHLRLANLGYHKAEKAPLSHLGL